MLLRPLPMREQDRVVVLWGRTETGFDNWPMNLETAREFARQSRTLERTGFYAYEGAWPQAVRGVTETPRLRQALVSGEFFAVLDAAPVLGRALEPNDDVAGAAPVVVLSHRAWQRHFGGAPDVIGREFVLHGNDRSYRIVGVMPQGLDFPRGTDFWAPLVPARTLPGSDSTVAHVDVLARLGPGMPPEAARDELNGFYRQSRSTGPERQLQAVVHPLPRLVLGDVRPAVLAFTAAVVVLLLITCLNVANLLLVRGLRRARELALRFALGARRRSVIGPLLLEHGLLGLCGGAGGLLVAALGIRLFLAFAPPEIPRLDQIQVDALALAVVTAVSLGALLLFGVAPTFLTSRVEAQDVLRSGERHGPGRRARRLTEALVSAQIGLAVMVLSAAGVIARSLVKLERAELSLESSQLLIAELAFRDDLVSSRERQQALLDRLLAEVRAIPGVTAVSPVVAIPFAGSGGWDGQLRAEGQSDEDAAANPILNMEVVDPDYFAALGIPVLRGRSFTSRDGAGGPPVVVISETAARHFWPGRDPLGERLQLGSLGPFTVVGVVPETRYRDLRVLRPSVYFPLAQSMFPFAPLNLAIRVSGPPGAVIPALRHTVVAVDPGLGLAGADRFETFLRAPLAQPRLNAVLLGVFAGAALLLAAVGLFGVMAGLVGQRTRELGIRAALGASRASLQRLVLRRSIAITGLGLGAGLAAGLAGNQMLESLLYGVQPVDLVTMIAVTLVLSSVALLAAAAPARATSRVDPSAALRVE
jgi:predicted permease